MYLAHMRHAHVRSDSARSIFLMLLDLRVERVDLKDLAPPIHDGASKIAGGSSLLRELAAPPALGGFAGAALARGLLA